MNAATCPRCRECVRPRSKFCTRCGLAHRVVTPPSEMAQPANKGEVVRAYLFAAHLLVIGTACTVPFLPFALALHRHQQLKAVGWFVIWFLASVITGAALEGWDGPPWPRLSALWRARRSD